MTYEEAVKRLPRPEWKSSSNDIMTIRLGYDFEPHGRASECWEDVWSIKLHTVPGYWWSTTGWRRGGFEGMRFYGRTIEDAKAQMIGFMNWWLVESKEMVADGY